jgi:hypothetical protein
MFHIAGLSLRDVSEKYHVTMASYISVLTMTGGGWYLSATASVELILSKTATNSLRRPASSKAPLYSS